MNWGQVRDDVGSLCEVGSLARLVTASLVALKATVLQVGLKLLACRDPLVLESNQRPGSRAAAFEVVQAAVRFRSHPRSLVWIVLHQQDDMVLRKAKRKSQRRVVAEYR